MAPRGGPFEGGLFRGREPSPTLIDMTVEPDLSDRAHRAVTIITAPPGKPVIVPPYSAIRIVWEQPT